MKKFIARLIVSAVFMLPFSGIQTASAAETPTTFVKSVSTTVSGSSVSFTPEFDTATLNEELAGSSGSILIKKDSTTVNSIMAWTSAENDGFEENIKGKSFAWDGKTDEGAAICNGTGGLCPAGTYKIVIYVISPVDRITSLSQTFEKEVTIGSSTSLSLVSFVLSSNDVDPAPKGGNEDLIINYEFNAAPDKVTATIKDKDGQVVKTFTSSDKAAKSSFKWDGENNSGKLVPPGNYSIVLAAQKAGAVNVEQTKSVEVDYGDSNVSEISGFSISENSFDPDDEDLIIEFENDDETYISVEVRKSNGERVRTFDDYMYEEYGEDEEHSVSWDGRDDSGDKVSNGNYKVVVLFRNDYGVDSEEKSVTIDTSNNNSSTSSSGNTHIGGIELDPSSRFQPGVDDELVIQFDVKTNLDNLVVRVVRGDEEYELEDRDDVDKETNVELTWNGEVEDSDEDYASAGGWRVEFISKVGKNELKTSKSFDVEYDKPGLDDAFISKANIDNEAGEITYIVFKTDEEAEVTIFVLEDNKEDDEIVEEMEVEKNRWYAVEWDGGSYDYEDSVKIKIVAANKINEDVSSSKTLSVDLKEEDDSSSRADITEDYIDPPVTNGGSAMDIHYTLDDEAEVIVSIIKGHGSSGTEVIKLLNSKTQEEGDYTLEWNGKDKKGNKLSQGEYSYKIVSKKSSTDTEIGYFIVGPVGGVDGSDSDDDEDEDEDDDDGVSPNVNIGRGDDDDDNEDSCAGYEDIDSDDDLCEAIEWASDLGIFKGYSNGDFKPNQKISRAEMIKVAMLAGNVEIDGDEDSLDEFVDVDRKAWYAEYLATAKEMRIFSGDKGRATARPGDVVNRAEALKFALESANEGDGVVLRDCDEEYSDVSNRDWFFEYACVAASYDLLSAFGGGSILSPGRDMTRGEVAEMLYRMREEGLL